MSFFEKMKLARENKDHLAFGEMLSENYTFDQKNGPSPVSGDGPKTKKAYPKTSLDGLI